MNHGTHGTHGRRGWWRSPLPWIGGFGLSFMVWAWVTSNSMLSILGQPRGFEVSSAYGAVRVLCLTKESGYKYTIRRVEGMIETEAIYPGTTYGGVSKAPQIWFRQMRSAGRRCSLASVSGPRGEDWSGFELLDGGDSLLGARARICGMAGGRDGLEAADEEGRVCRMNYGTRGNWRRSRLFWLGLPGFVFLGWAWASSQGYHSEISIRAIAFGHYQGIALISSPNRVGGWIGRPYIGIFGKPYSGVKFSRAAAREDRVSPMGPWRVAIEGVDRARFRLLLDARLAMGIYLATWLGTAWWRFRWKSRVLTTTTTPPADV